MTLPQTSQGFLVLKKPKAITARARQLLRQRQSFQTDLTRGIRLQSGKFGRIMREFRLVVVKWEKP